MKTYTYNTSKGDKVDITAEIVELTTGKLIVDVKAIYKGIKYTGYTTDIPANFAAAGFVATIDKIGLNSINGHAVAEMIETVKAESAEYQQQLAEFIKNSASLAEYDKSTSRTANAMRE